MNKKQIKLYKNVVYKKDLADMLIRMNIVKLGSSFNMPSTWNKWNDIQMAYSTLSMHENFRTNIAIMEEEYGT